MTKRKGFFTEYHYFKGLGEGIPYHDYHNHFGGVLPYKNLYDLYIEYYNYTSDTFAKECKSLFCDELAVKFSRFKSEIGLFLRTTYHLLNEKYDFTAQGNDPIRGAHVAMISVFCLFLFSGKAGILAKKDLDDLSQQLLNPVQIKNELNKYLQKCYKWYAGTNTNPAGCMSVAKRAFMNYVRATRYTPFDDGYIGRSSYLKIFDKKRKFDVKQFGYRSMKWLYDEEGIRYVEMSQPKDKIPEAASYKETHWCKWLFLGNFHKIKYPIPKYYQVIIGSYEIIWVGYYQ